MSEILTANMTPVQILTAYDRFLSGEPGPERGFSVSRAVALAAVFGAEAYEKGVDANQGSHALARSFLLALIDPLNPELDYLRCDPKAGAIAREAL